MWEADLRSVVAAAVAREGPRLRVATRRYVLACAEEHVIDVWLCEACGETHEEGLACYEVRRVTRASVGSVVCLCGECADRVPFYRVVSS